MSIGKSFPETILYNGKISGSEFWDYILIHYYLQKRFIISQFLHKIAFHNLHNINYMQISRKFYQYPNFSVFRK